MNDQSIVTSDRIVSYNIVCRSCSSALAAGTGWLGGVGPGVERNGRGGADTTAAPNHNGLVGMRGRGSEPVRLCLGSAGQIGVLEACFVGGAGRVNTSSSSYSIHVRRRQGSRLRAVCTHLVHTSGNRARDIFTCIGRRSRLTSTIIMLRHIRFVLSILVFVLICEVSQFGSEKASFRV
jgi:hypothetical protein